VVLPLLDEVGSRWERREFCVASEHLASSVVRSLLGGLLRRRANAAGSKLLFTTLAGDHHELAVLVCAVIAAELGAQAVYLGPDLPAGEVAVAARKARAAVVVCGISLFAASFVRTRALRELRRALPPDVMLWVGGSGLEDVELPRHTEAMPTLDAFEQKVEAFVLRPVGPR
jgi:methanogenic corrinoid protein MtbC1